MIFHMCKVTVIWQSLFSLQCHLKAYRAVNFVLITDTVVTSYRFVSNSNRVSWQPKAWSSEKEQSWIFMENQIILKPVNLVLVSTASAVHVAKDSLTKLENVQN